MIDFGTRLEQFLAALPASSGFVFGARERAAVNELLLALFARGELPESAERWRSLLAPIVCGTRQQQEEFRARFDAAFAEGVARVKVPSPPASPFRWWMALAAFMLVLAAGGGWYAWRRWQPVMLTLSNAELAPKSPALPPSVRSVPVQGTLRSESGEAVANAEVAMPGQRFRTDAGGKFTGSVSGAGAGFPMLVSHPDYRSSVAFLPVRDNGIKADLRLPRFDAAPKIELKSLERVREVAGPRTGSTVSEISADGLRVTSGGIVWDAATGAGTTRSDGEKAFERFKASAKGTGHRLSRNGKLFAFVDDQFGYFSVRDEANKKAFATRDSARFAEFSPDSMSVAVVMTDGIEVLDVGGKALVNFRFDGSRVSALAFTPDGTRLVSLEKSGSVTVWDPTNRKYLSTFNLPLPLRDIRLSRDNRLLIGSLDDSTTAVYDAANGRELTRVARGGAIQIAPNGNLLIAGPDPLRTDDLKGWTWLGALIPLAALTAWWIWLYQKRARLRRFSLPLELDTRALQAPPAEPAYRNAFVRKLAMELRRRKAMGAGGLAVEPTIAASMQRGGFLTPRYATRTQQREYVVLLHKVSAGDQHARLYLELLAQLKAEGALVEVYTFHSAAGGVFRPGGKAIPLEELAAIHPHHDLWILADPAHFQDPFTLDLAPWLTDLSRWADRAMLSPVAVETRLRGLLERDGFRVTEATPEGMAALVETLDRETGPGESATASRYPEELRHLPLRWLERRVPDEGEAAAMLSDLRRYVGPEGMALVSACAIYPELNWPLTCWLAERLCDGKRRESVLARVTSLPWFRYGWMPDWLRARLVNRMTPAMDREARAPIEEFLSAVRPGEGTDGLRVGRRGAGEDGEGKPLRDYVMLEFLAGRKPEEKLAVRPAARLKRLLFYGGHFLMGARVWRHALMALVLAGLGWYAASLAIGAAGSRVVLSEWKLPTAAPVVKPAPRVLPKDPVARLVLAAAESQVEGGGARVWRAAFVPDVVEFAGQLEGRALVARQTATAAPGVSYAEGFIESVEKGQAYRAQVIRVKDGKVERARVALPTGPYREYVTGDAMPLPLPPQGPKVNPRDGLTYLYIPPGKFVMGCSPGDAQCDDDEKPAHAVEITKGFWLGQTEVTVEAYRRFANATKRAMPEEPSLEGKALNPGWKDGRMPMVNVDWNEAAAYCAWVGGRLPTEAEWEYAARAGSAGARYGALDSIAWYGDNAGAKRIDSTAELTKDVSGYTKLLVANGNSFHAVGGKQPNAFGLFDMLGNVWEWNADWFDDKYYAQRVARDPRGPAKGELRSLRGGAWYNIPENLRVSVPSRNVPSVRGSVIGLRCAGEFP